MQKITPFLWFDGKAEEAANFYVSLFPGSRIVSTMPGPDGKAMGVTFELAGQQFYALNGGPQFTFTPAISMFVNCETQAEVDELWEKISAGGQKQRCGWVTDKYGLSWQIVPTVLGRMLGDPDRNRANRVMQAMLQMEKLDSAALKRAYEEAA
jgi:predicted 3-demethylubiquinone-9 3-methyltransferase (glyoxalase superfamily)